jgi:hypothetical protein
MSKVRLPTLLFVLSMSFFGRADAIGNIITEIYLVDNEALHQRHIPPGKIIIGIEVRSDALYKLSSQEGILQGGLFQKGFNSLAISAQRFFDKTDSHLFELELKTDNVQEKKEITIEIRLLPLYVVQKRGEEEKKHEFTLSLFLRDQLIYATRKFSLQGISFKFDLPPSDGRYNPFGLMKGIQKPINTVSVLDAVAGIFQLAKSLAPGEKKDEEEKFIEKKQQIETTFVKRDVTGDFWEWKALISIETKDQQN